MATSRAQGYNRNKAKPATPAGKALSARHLKENIAYNRAHAADHLKQAASDSKELAKVRKKDAKASVKRAKKS